MILKHVALVCTSEDNSDRFYEHLLGLTKISSKFLSKKLSEQIFDIDSEYKIVNYANDSVRFEIFIRIQGNCVERKDYKTVEHVCIEVEGLVAVFLAKCRMLGIKVLQIPKGDKIVTLIRDYDGNLFEINAKF
ncbi:MAG: VOC family protein [Desulfobacterales bacterium]|uniref:VOC family protein n=1 Tax=Candidatus Desulfatibia profunda TaxID=2841695 RepID=A0A8J6NQB0_9BACT|nr:VOC family protein [Candidatus Desulfatibia profunda]MBL7181013.1 VOC family protein [Desulfobacterales bacterium]